MIVNKYKIREICQLNKNSYSKKDKWRFFNYLDTKNIVQNEIDNIEFLDPSIDKIPSRAKRKVDNEDIIISTVRPNQKHYGIIRNQPLNFLVSTAFTTLSVNKNIAMSLYVYYYITQNYIIEFLQTIAEQATTSYPSIKASDIGNLDISLPDLEYQNKVISILNNLDSKINFNKKLNHNLYHILMDLFIKNYLNFNENEFSNSIETIPKLWNIGHFNDIIKEVIAGDWGKSEIEGNYTKKTFCIRGADIPDLKENFVSTIPIRYILQKNFNKKHLIENSVVIEISGGSPSQSTGRTLFITNNLLNQYNHDLICTNFCKSILAEEEYSYFVYFYLNYLYDRNVMFAYENGTTGIKNFDFKSFFNNFPIIIPVKEELVTFNKICELFFDKIYKNIDEMNKLSHIKNILLPKLMSGEIDVSNIKI